jgi:hypothetical protein
MSIGGFVKFSASWNFTGNQDTTSHGEGVGAGFGSPAGSQLDNAFNGGNWDFTARRSRVWFQTWTPTDWGELRTYIEMDFAGSQPAIPRLRHAYGTLGPVLIGQTNTLFGGLIGAPELLDDGAPQVLGALRVPQIRYSHNFGHGLVLSVALEDSAEIGDAGSGIIGSACNSSGTCSALTGAQFAASQGFLGPRRWPNVTAALQWNFPNGAIYASGMVGQLDVDSGTGSYDGQIHADSSFRWGGALAGMYQISPRVEIGGQGYVGRGIGWKYNAPPTAFRDAILISYTGTNADDLRGILSYGGTAYVQVKLTDTIRSTGAFSWGQEEAASEVPGYYNAASVNNNRTALAGTTNVYWSAHGNILWNPVPQVTFGAEYSYQFASKYNSANASINRIEFAAIYRF